MPGVWVVKVTDEKTLQATALVVGSDLDAIVKVSREQVLVFAQDMKTGKGRKGARVLVADGSGVILEKTTGDDGVLLASWDKPLAGQPRTRPGCCPTPPPVPGPRRRRRGRLEPGRARTRWRRGSTPRAYIYTDRPAYRPGQEVALRGVVREAKDGQYANPAGRVVQAGGLRRPGPAPGRPAGQALGVRHLPRGASGSTRRPRSARTASACSSRARGTSPARSRSSRTSSRRSTSSSTCPGRSITGARRSRPTSSRSISTARRSSGRPIEVALPDGRIVRGTTDASGKFHVEFATDGFAEEQALRLVARLPGDNVAAVGRGDAGDQGVPDRPERRPATSTSTARPSPSTPRPSTPRASRPASELRVAVLKQVDQGRRGSPSARSRSTS